MGGPWAQASLKKAGLWEKVVAFGSDGASVLTGKNKGVASKIRDEVAYLIALHCICHRGRVFSKHRKRSLHGNQTGTKVKQRPFWEAWEAC